MFFFFFNDTATTEIYTLSLHDALPILHSRGDLRGHARARRDHADLALLVRHRSEERRVGKECRSRWSQYHYKKKQKPEHEARSPSTIRHAQPRRRKEPDRTSSRPDAAD